MSALTIEQLSILLAEPSSAQRKFIGNHLHALGVKHIEAAQTGAEVLTTLSSNSPDLVISTMHLPDMTGTELLETIRQGEVQPGVPYMLISSETHDQLLEPIRQAGAIAILPKPFEQEQLRTALYAALDYLDPGKLVSKHVLMEDLNVLLVDDSGLSRRHTSRILQTMGIEQITEAENGRQAFEMVQQNYYDLIVTDFHMPEMDGREFVEHVRHASEQPSIPILMISSEQDRDRLAAVQQAGVSTICEKPFDTATLKQLIENILE